MTISAHNSRNVIKKLRKGDKDTFRAIHQDFYLTLYAYAFKVTKSKNLSSQATEDIFLDIWQKRRQIPKNISLETLLLLKVHHKCLIMMDTPQEGLDSCKIDFDSLTTAQIDIKFMEALATMPEPEQTVFKMSRFSGFSIAEIAGKTSNSEEEIEGLLGKALMTLEEKMSGDLNTIKSINLLKFIFS